LFEFGEYYYIMSSMDQKRDQLTDRAHQLYYQAQQNAPNSRQILGLVTLLLAGGLLLLLGGLALTGTTITALLATPVLIFFSPILIPLAVVAFFTIGGLLGAGTFGVAVLSAISWAYNYYKGRHPFGADQVMILMFACRHHHVCSCTSRAHKGRV
jgi:hypothetical protein